MPDGRRRKYPRQSFVDRPREFPPPALFLSEKREWTNFLQFSLIRPPWKTCPRAVVSHVQYKERNVRCHPPGAAALWGSRVRVFGPPRRTLPIEQSGFVLI